MRLFDDEAKSQVIHHVYPTIKFITRSHHTNATQCMHNGEVARHGGLGRLNNVFTQSFLQMW